MPTLSFAKAGEIIDSHKQEADQLALEYDVESQDIISESVVRLFQESSLYSLSYEEIDEYAITIMEEVADDLSQTLLEKEAEKVGESVADMIDQVGIGTISGVLSTGITALVTASVGVVTGFSPAIIGFGSALYKTYDRLHGLYIDYQIKSGTYDYETQGPPHEDGLIISTIKSTYNFIEKAQAITGDIEEQLDYLYSSGILSFSDEEEEEL